MTVLSYWFPFQRAYSPERNVFPQLLAKCEMVSKVVDERLPTAGLGKSAIDQEGWKMNAADFRRIALSLEGAEEGAHMGSADFRVGGRIFATLASEDEGYGNLVLTPEMQADFVAEAPEVFVPIHRGWGRMGMTHIRLAKASEDVLAGALRAAWKLRIEKNQMTKRKAKKRSPRKHA